MIVVYPFSLVDQELALKNAQWMTELGGGKGHEVYVLHDKRCALARDIIEELKKSFDTVYVNECPAEIDGWPQGANYFFRMAATKLETKPNTPYFMWMEPDAVPLGGDWLNRLQHEYEKVARQMGKFFMGDRVQVEDIPLHMSGVGIYPLPLHAYAGEAYRASEIAWDMAGREQIVPKAHFTKLIEHAWKHPSFTSHEELITQIREGAVLFHSSKDGSLIDLLRTAVNLEGETIPASSHGSTKEREEPLSPPPMTTCDIVIRTYPGDYKWLDYCLQSIKKYCTGFRKVWVVSPDNSPLFTDVPTPIQWKRMADETEDGYLAQQITKVYADVITDYQPDFILHVDSDVVFTRPCTPASFMHEGKVVWFFTPYSEIETPWKPITEQFMGEEQPFEFMRRFPIMVPRWLYPKVREFCHRRHGMIISQYIRNQPHRAFSEFNVLGAYAYRYHKDMFTFINTIGFDWNNMPPLAKQFHSWGGITPEIQKELDTILGEVVEPPPTAEAGTAGTEAGRSLPRGIKELKNGIWVIEGDTHVGRWVEQQERLDHDQNSLPFILPLIKPGDVVVDAGAFIGDHTIAYLLKTGPSGEVYAFEPNALAMTCLRHNLQSPNLFTFETALGREAGTSTLSPNSRNFAGSYIGRDCQEQPVSIATLDSFNLGPDFIKFDIEGCEVDALLGAKATIEQCRPVMVLEVNASALHRQGRSKEKLFEVLKSYGYEWEIMQENCVETDPMYDIIARPKGLTKSLEAPISGAKDKACLVVPTSPPPVSFSPLTTKMAVDLLASQAAESPNGRWRVMMALHNAGLTPRNKGKKKHVKRTAPATADKKAPEITTPDAQPKRAKRNRRTGAKGLV